MMFEHQKDWTLKLFLHNFFKENGLEQTLGSFENEVLQSPFFNQELPIKSNKTFLLEWWNIFFELYSENLLSEFKKKFPQTAGEENNKEIKMTEVFKTGIFNNGGFTLNSNDFNQFLTNFDKNSFLLSSFGLTKNYNNMNMNLNIPTSNASNFQKLNPQNFNFGRQPPTNEFLNFNMNEKPKNHSESSSMSLSSEGNIAKEVKKPRRNFFSSSNAIKRLTDEEIELLKKRKRYIKNNKFVYLHPSSAAAKKLIEEFGERKIKEEVEDTIKIEENEMDLKDDEKVESIKSIDSDHINKKKPRGSRYRGVSRNGNQWQVLIMVSKKKRYVGSYSNEEEAARAYDKVALQNHGTKAKTNYDYKDEEVKKIISEPPLLKIY